MKIRSFAALLLAPALALATPGAGAGAPGPVVAPRVTPGADAAAITATVALPLFDDRFADVVIATAGDEAITLSMLSAAMEASHQDHKGGAAPAKMEFQPMLQRLLDVRLLLAEAHTMGIQDLEDVKLSVEAWEEDALRELVQRHAVKDVKPDALEVEAAYRAATQQWKLRSVKFAKEADAAAFKAALNAGGDFGALAKAAIDAKQAEGDLQGLWAGAAKMLPAVAAAVKGREAGAVTEPIKLADGFAVARVDEVRFVDDAKVRGELEQQSVLRQTREKLPAYYEELTKRWAKVDWALAKRLNYEAKGWERMKQDKRTLATFKGGAAPITVADLTAALEKQLYHGMERGVREKKVNRLKELTLDALVSLRVVPLEAKALGIADGRDYQRRRAAYEDQIVFGNFLRKAVAPDVKVTEEKLRAYYDAHRAEFTTPVLYKLETVGFPERKDAEAAAGKLRAGTDARWLRANSERQLDAKVTLALHDGVISARTMPDDLQALLAGTKPGDVRLWSAPEGQHFAVRVADVNAAVEQPFEETVEAIRPKVFGEELGKAISAYAEKLRAVFPVKVYITRIGA